MRNKKGIILITTGLLLVAVALSLLGYNLYEDHAAHESAAKVVDHFVQIYPEKFQWRPLKDRTISVY